MLYKNYAICIHLTSLIIKKLFKNVSHHMLCVCWGGGGLLVHACVRVCMCVWGVDVDVRARVS